MQAKVQTKEVSFKLIAVEKFPVARGRVEDVYTYVSTDRQFGIQFHPHPRRAFSYSILRTHNLSLGGPQYEGRNRASIIEAFITRHLNSETFGGREKAIAQLDTKLIVGVGKAVMKSKRKLSQSNRKTS